MKSWKHIPVKTILPLLFIMSNALWGQVNVAVLSFSNQSRLIALDHWEQVLPDLLTMELARYSDVRVVERQRLDEVLQEQKLSLSGLSDDSLSLTLGQLLQAQVIIHGTVHYLNGQYQITVKMVRVKNGQIFSEQVKARKAQLLEAMVHLLANNIHYTLTGRGAFIKERSVGKNPAWLWAGGGALLLLGGWAALVKSDDYYQQYHTAMRPDQMDSYYQKANNSHKTGYFLLSAAVTSFSVALWKWFKWKAGSKIIAREPTFAGYFNFRKKQREVMLGVVFPF